MCTRPFANCIFEPELCATVPLPVPPAPLCGKTPLGVAQIFATPSPGGTKLVFATPNSFRKMKIRASSPGHSGTKHGLVWQHNLPRVFAMVLFWRGRCLCGVVLVSVKSKRFAFLVFETVICCRRLLLLVTHWLLSCVLRYTIRSHHHAFFVSSCSQARNATCVRKRQHL